MARRKRRAWSLQAGIKLLALGFALLLLPMLVKASDPWFGPVARALQAPGWISGLIGIVILGLHFLARRRMRWGSRRKRVAIWEQKTKDGDNLQLPWHGAASSIMPVNLPTVWDERVLELMEWRRFNAVCEALFAQAGYRIRNLPHGTENGVDLWLYASGVEEPVAAVRFKHWKRQPIPVERIRAFAGALMAQELRRGIFITSSVFTPDALAAGQAKGIQLLDGAGLIRLIRQRPAEQQAELLAIALEGEFWKPSCPNCHIKLSECSVPHTSGPFWCCPNYPKCRFALPMTETESQFVCASRGMVLHAMHPEPGQKEPDAPITRSPSFPRPGTC